jgi:hypothetical protein
MSQVRILSPRPKFKIPDNQHVSLPCYINVWGKHCRNRSAQETSFPAMPKLIQIDASLRILTMKDVGFIEEGQNQNRMPAT